MKKLSVERMSEVQGGDICYALMWCIYNCNTCNYSFCMNQFVAQCGA